jgi:hypothetical protein
MNANRIGIGIEPDQEQINGGATTKAVFDSLSKIQKSLKTSRCRQRIVTAMGSAALMMWIKRAEVIRHHLEVMGLFAGWIGLALPMTTMLCFTQRFTVFSTSNMAPA